MTNKTPDLIGFIPEPRYEYGLYHYACNCQFCSWRNESDKGMNGPEKAYEKHWLKYHKDVLTP